MQTFGRTTSNLAKAVKEDLPSRPWPVYRDYEVVVEAENGETYVVAAFDLFVADEAAGQGQQVKKRWRRRDPVEAALNNYLPLRTPELVVDLARLADNTITPEAVVGWAETYGLLASSREEDVLERPGLIGRDRISGYACRESVSRFATAAAEVRTCLRIHEALERDKDLDLEELFSEVGRPPEDAMRPQERKLGHERAWLLGVLGRMVQIRLLEHCYPQFNVSTRGRYPTGRFVLSWGFYNLLGAIWIQMAWLLEAAESSVKFCRLPDCRRVITFKPGRTADEIGTIKGAEGRFKRNARGKYKTRTDRYFCRGRGCKQKYNYRKKAGWDGYI